MLRTRVKICGITRAEDAVAAVACGVDAVGLVFYPPSPRHVSIQQARLIIEKIPSFVNVVAVLVDPEKDYIENIINTLPITLLQFHGGESVEFCQQFRLPYLKAMQVTVDIDIEAQCRHYDSATAVLLDTCKAGLPGGSGETFNWQLIPDKMPTPWVLAGGLNLDNMARAITELHPYAVDISSGVESSKGIKDKLLIRQLMQLIRDIDHQNNTDNFMENL